MKLRYAGVCRLCGLPIPARTEAFYERSTKTVRCVVCPQSTIETDVSAGEPSSVSPVVNPGENVAGSSARREYERRKAKDEERLRAKWGRLGGVAVALSSEKQSTKAWERGAVGEELLGKRLDSIRSDNIAVLHDRRIPGSRANIDHIAITRTGIWVIDAKRYKDRRPELKVEGGLLRPRVEKLLVGGRDSTKLVDSVLQQTQLVRDVVGEVPVTGALCFVEADWPLIGGSFTTRGVHVLWPKLVTKQLLTASADGNVDVPHTLDSLTAHFKAA
ncbi:MAG TPA: nuclease-related domain-containing protein [Actinomycetes bacterium]|nr:nuclease-related domain-containing protein [Actinomycetes bacterium]